MSREDVAATMHKSPHTITSWETSDRQPRTMREIERLCQLLNITVIWYLAGKGPKHPISSTTEQELLSLFSGLNAEQQHAVLQMMRVMG
ncbi:transcriptional repressor DicA [Vibrio spartinae]|uniref:Transcriptional repressor DicA n=2 Tax=Vibrio spartinae TaxID=1918945 RepID=A0A1N6M5Q0_9VIBR|nr:transcriptional repressor DicA [Vibrio spartinae]